MEFVLDHPVFIGVDPGQSGGVAVVFGENGGVAWPLRKMTERDISDLFVELRYKRVAMAVIEKVHSMPKQGVASSFKFGVNYGFLRGMLCAHRLRFTEVTPAKWQRVMECRTKGDKNVTKARAQQLFPDLKITHATADALLIAEYGRRVHS